METCSYALSEQPETIIMGQAGHFCVAFPSRAPGAAHGTASGMMVQELDIKSKKCSTYIASLARHAQRGSRRYEHWLVEEPGQE